MPDGVNVARGPIDYLNPQLPPGLRCVRMPVVDAKPASVEGYGRLVGDPSECRIEIVRWPAQGRRPVDAGTGAQGDKQGAVHARVPVDLAREFGCLLEAPISGEV